MPKLKPRKMYCYEGVYRGSPGVLARVTGHKSKFFSHAKHGKDGAMTAALVFVNSRIDRSRVNQATGRHVRKKAGVFRMVREVKMRGKKYKSARWVAQWQKTAQVNARREFSVKKYGEAGAKRLATELRARKVQEILTRGG